MAFHRPMVTPTHASMSTPPHEFITQFRNTLGATPGEQGDAAEALELMLSSTGLATEVFSASEVTQADGVTMLPTFNDVVREYFVSDDEPPQLRVDALLEHCLTKTDRPLVSTPPLLAVRLPPFYELGDDDAATRFWLTDRCVPFWDDGSITLAGTTRYQLTAFVQHTGVDQFFTPKNVVQDGHFVAYFCEDSIWYMANDSVVTRCGCAGPQVYPYLCFFSSDAICPTPLGSPTRHGLRCHWRPPLRRSHMSNRLTLVWIATRVLSDQTTTATTTATTLSGKLC